MIKILILLLIVFIIFNLGRGLFFLLKKQSDREQVAKALTWRVGLSFVLFLFLIAAILLGWIQPNGLW